MNRILIQSIACTLPAMALAGSPTPVLTVNPGFTDPDQDGQFGDAWGVFGAAAVDFRFFGDSNVGHATLFGDNTANTGGAFQQGITATAGTTYEATFRFQWESNWDARTRFGIEFYAADDTTKIGEQITEITEDTAFAGAGYRRYDTLATAPAGTAFVRPIALVDEVLSSGASRACTVDNVLVREADDILNLNPGFGDPVGDGLLPADFWIASGDAAIDLEYAPSGNPGHATLFGDAAGNSGAVFQQGVPAVAGESYTFSVDLSFEENWDATTRISLEFYGSGDGFLVGRGEAEIVEAPGAGYVTYQVEAASQVAFTRFVRPVVTFENAAGGGTLAAATIDNAVIQRTSTLNPGCNEADLAETFGVLDLSDINAFVAGFIGQNPIADIDSNGIFDLTDINRFVSAFTGGCP